VKPETITLINLVIAVVALIVAGLAMHANWKSAMWVEKQTRSATRPHVFYDMVTGLHRVEAVLKCSGMSAAYDIRVSLNPPVKVKVRNIPTSSIAERTTPFLAPGREVREFLGSFEEMKATSPGLQFTIKVSYRDTDRNQYTEQYSIDVDNLGRLPHVARPTVEDRLEQIADAITEVSRDRARERALAQANGTKPTVEQER
jgi:hypothetical protein